MSSTTRTIKRAHHIRIPTFRDGRYWAEKAFTSGKATDAALFVMVVMLCGWLLYCLARPFADYQFLF